MKAIDRAIDFFASFRNPVIVLLLICLITGISPRLAFANGWVAQAGAPLDYLNSVAMSSGGGEMIVGTALNNDLAISTDGGQTWNTTLSAEDSDNTSWSAVAMSADGQDIVGVQDGGYIWYSPNGGAAWERLTDTPDTWTSVTMSADGQKIAATDNSLVAVSTDGGDTWNNAMLPDRDWVDVSYSPNGEYLAAAADDNADSFVSTDDGQTWPENFDSPSGPWTAIAVDNSEKVVIGGLGDILVGHLLNGSLSWSDTEVSAADNNWSDIAMTPSGGTIIASVNDGTIWVSSDGGTDWAQQNDPGTAQWLGVATNQDGTFLAAAGGYNILYTFGTPGEDIVSAAVLTEVTPVPSTVTTSSVTYEYSASYPDDEQEVLVSGDCEDLTVEATEVSNSETNSIIISNLAPNTTYTCTLNLRDDNDNVSNTLTIGPFTYVPPVATGSTGGSGSSGGTSVAQQVENLLAMSNTARAAQIESQWPNLFSGASTTPAVQPAAGTAGTSTPVFTRDLELGMSGNDVKALQQFLNAHGFPIAASGAGSAGNETTYFGALTKTALAAYQAANGITPAAGYFGPLTRAYVAAHP